MADLGKLRKFDQRIVVSSIESQLPDQPTQESRNRKRLRPNKLAEWELRIEDHRVFYDVDPESSVVKVIAVGEKHGNQLLIHGEEYEL